ncbi:MAG TPA: OmpH family outer membrane protein, partial [Bacteroidia bacterium]|nr:OmpH family outer membrane protein [Bacteroidia bacterium]
MKKQMLFAVIVLLFSGMTAMAQTLKFGHIDSGALIQMMPQTKSADSTLKRFGESLDGQLKAMTAEYQTKLQSYQSKADSLPDAIRATKEKEL